MGLSSEMAIDEMNRHIDADYDYEQYLKELQWKEWCNANVCIHTNGQECTLKGDNFSNCNGFIPECKNYKTK